MNTLAVLAAVVSSAACGGPSGRTGCDSAVLPLFENGRSAWTVVIDRDAAPPERYAAEEFTNFVFKISGARLAVATEDGSPKLNIVRITAPDGDTMSDRFTVESAPGKILLEGNSPRAALFAVYAFLRDRLGARWYWPGEGGEFLPRLERFEVDERKKSYSPVFDQRALSICKVWRHRHNDVERWFPRVFINCGINTPAVQRDVGAIRRVTGHYISLPENMEKRKRVFAEHPQWFSLLNGKRDLKGYAGCWSNEEYFNYVVSNAVELIRESRAQQANLFTADILPRCECSGCTRESDVSARWWLFYGRIIEAVRREIPGMSFTGLAYQEYRDIPGVQIRNVDHVEYCHYNRCYYHRLGDATCPRNVKSMDEFRRWGEKAPLGFYGYAFDAMSLKKPLYLPLWRMIADEMRVFRNMDMRRVKTEYQVDLQLLPQDAGHREKSRILLLASRLSFYAWAMAAFDPDADMDLLVDDFCRRVYGAGAGDMKAYHNLMADAWEGMKSHIGYYFNSPRGPARDLISDRLKAEARSRLASAAGKTLGDPRAHDEVLLDAECFENWVREAEDAKSNAVVHPLSRTGAADPLAEAGWLEAKARRGRAQPTRLQVARGVDRLFVLAKCADSGMKAFDRGSGKKDDPNVWGLGAYIEMFIENAVGDRYQLAVSPAGGVWDKRNGDIKWNSSVKAATETSEDGWTMKIELPFADFGGVPKPGDGWKLMVIRNVAIDPGAEAKHSSCGWPVDAHGDWGSAAVLKFR